MTPDCGRHPTASAVVLDPAGDRTLLVRHKAHGGLWMLPGGHVEQDEAAHEAALREIWEETGVRAAIAGQVTADLPGVQTLPSPWLTLETPAPARPGQRPHIHIDQLFIAVADSSLPLTATGDTGVERAHWWPVAELAGIGCRAEVPQVTAMAVQAMVAWERNREQDADPAGGQDR